MLKNLNKTHPIRINVRDRHLPINIGIVLIAILVSTFICLLTACIVHEPKNANLTAIELAAPAGTKVGAGSMAGPLRVDPTNPRYFTNDSGKAIYVAGGHTWYNIHYNSKNKRMSDSEFDTFLNWMESHGYNFTRLWTGWGNNFPKPWKKVNGKFDMTKYNQSYFDTLRRRVEKIQARGMYCSVMFFGSLIAMSTESGWRKMAWYPDNNINPELSNAFSVTDGYSFFTKDPRALAIQRQFVKKMIDTLNDLDNIIWEIGNEADLPHSYNWQYGMINFVKSYESTKPKQHLVGMTSDGISNNNDWILNSPADWISPDQVNSDNYKEGGPASYDSKILINDVDHLWGHFTPGEVNTGRKWVWKTFTRGNNPILMDCYTAHLPSGPTSEYQCDGVLDPTFDPIRNALGDTITYSKKLDLAHTFPSDKTVDCSTRYCLRNPGNEYLVYQPNSGTFTLNLVAGNYYYEWFNPDSDTIAGTGKITAGNGNRSFTPPFSGDAVLYLKKTDSRDVY